MSLESRISIIVGDQIENVTPERVAELFANMNSTQQAHFFNHVAAVTSKWDQDFCFQLQFITDDDELTLAGRRVMSDIGEYSHWGLVPQSHAESQDD
jgi:hypothetical protein